MGKLIIILLLVGAVAAGYFFFIADPADRFSLMPSFMLTEEEQRLRHLESQLQDVKQAYAQSHRMAAVGGIDTTADVESARARVRAIEKELKALAFPEGRGKAKAERVLSAIEQFSRAIS